MRQSSFYFTYLLMLVAQLALSDFFTFTPYMVLSILPVMVLCIPIRVDTVPAMIIAFFTGLAVDYLSEGIIGINAFALVPVALMRNSIIELVFGRELFTRKEDFNARRAGMGKISLAILLSQLVFMLIYVWADSAGTRPLWFNTARVALSVAGSSVLSLVAVSSLAPDTRR